MRRSSRPSRRLGLGLGLGPFLSLRLGPRPHETVSEGVPPRTVVRERGVPRCDDGWTTGAEHRGMTTSTPTTVRLSSPRPSSAARAVLAVGAGLSAVAFAIAVVGLIVDPTVLTGAPAWMK